LIASILKATVAVIQIPFFVVGAAFMAEFSYPAAVSLGSMTGDRTFHRKFAALPAPITGFGWHYAIVLF
jgi:hypothetical protein